VAVPAQRPQGPGLVPILVDGAGRDGTTLMMQLLGTSPRITFDRVPPFEHRYFAYLLEWARLLGRTEWDAATWNDGALVQRAFDRRGGNLVGPPPWAERELIDGGGDGEMWTAVLSAVWSEFSRRAAKATADRTGGSPADVAYHAEKCIAAWRLQGDAAEVVAVEVIPLVRDPRDVWLSTIEFDRRRGFYGFGRLDGESEADYLSRFMQIHRWRLTEMGDWMRRTDTPVVRYEDLVLDLEAEAAKLEDRLGVELDPAAVIAATQGFRDHMTSATAELSAQRWRREMTAEVRDRFRRDLGDQMAAFGYEP
jgi:hypothetical protein